MSYRKKNKVTGKERNVFPFCLGREFKDAARRGIQAGTVSDRTGLRYRYGEGIMCDRRVRVGVIRWATIQCKMADK